jgi:hypothetical protein
MADMTRAIGIAKLMIRSMREFPPIDEHKEAAINRAVDLATRHIVGIMGISMTDYVLQELRSVADDLWNLYIVGL